MFFSGRGTKSHAYTHSVQDGHRVYLNLQTQKFYCLPDNYEIIDSSLEDIIVSKFFFFFCKHEFYPIIISPVGCGYRIRRLHLCRGARHPPPTGPPVGRGWRPMMLKDGILVAEQSMTCNTPPWPLLELDGRSERPPSEQSAGPIKP